MGKKVKVEYDVGRKPEKKKRKSRTGVNTGKLGKMNVIAFAILLVVEAIFYYFATPAINIHKPGFWTWVIVTLGLIYVCSLDFTAERIFISDKKNESLGFTSMSKYILYLMAACVLVLLIGGIVSSKLIMASKYANIIEIEEGDFTTDVPESENISNIALMDTDSARIIGERAIGSLSDVVSQYEVSTEYSTIDYNGVPMKVASLEYAGFFKYMNNKADGIPGYVLVDPVKNEAKYVKLTQPIKYSPSAYFNHNLQRHVQLSYPTYDFNGYYFELDNDGNPYYICPVLSPNAGLFGAKDVKGIVICDPCTGDCEYMDVANVPNWVDRVYDGDLACKKYNWNGMLSGGFLNSIVGNKGCKVTTDDYGYKVMEGDVWVYTGVTSVNGDQSNIGFVLMNSRTGESKYFSIAGAEEHSAMSSAEGQVQNLGYVASFPSLININGVPTYIMVLKDNAGLVKMYALVNVEKYNIVATGATQKDALVSYRKLLAQNEIISDDKTATEDTPSKKITVKDIRYITMDGETYVYITDKDGAVYKQNFADNEALIFIQENDIITVYYIEAEDGINQLISYE
ncbi:MAG: hypothetical protein J5962_02625 [Lachnospiraceae bacterium]|nr:hypothetical protein [Lachnospiraceae bacterium]